MIVEAAPAKVNLWLHVGPLRADGLHEIESLFVFADQGDVVRAEPANELSLEIEGLFAGALAGFPIQDNLVLRAASALQAAAGVRAGARLVLDKRLPVAAGIGGGSADAAAALRALARLWDARIAPESMGRLAFSLGADVPACLDLRPVYVAGAGERIEPGPALPPLHLCLVNPGVAMPTGPVFRDFDAAHPAPPSPTRLRPERLPDAEAVRRAMLASRNDLQPFALRRETVIGVALEFLAHCPGALSSRMSGSGATVFALFERTADAQEAARRAGARGWWALAAGVASEGAGRRGELQ